tara:strand:- start:8725 stop:8925 length:201 start_codon:yes stop_codon:yes gene_type:complete
MHEKSSPQGIRHEFPARPQRPAPATPDPQEFHALSGRDAHPSDAAPAARDHHDDFHMGMRLITGCR